MVRAKDNPSSHTVIGIDGGGSKTLGLLADASGRILARARAGGANLHVQGDEGVAESLGSIFEQLAPQDAPAAIGLGMAGVGREQDRRRLAAILHDLGIEARIRIEHDAHIALLAGAPEGLGVVVISGTGSIAYGLDAGGRSARAGGWGYLLGDEGSAYWLGHAALRRAIRAADGRGPATSLGERISARLDLQLPHGLVTWFYDQEHSRPRLAELAVLVEEAAKAGDPAGHELLDEAALHLARAARSVASQLSFDAPYALVLSGGAFRACPSLHGRARDAIAGLALPHARVTLLTEEPAVGALRLAQGLLAT